MDDPVYRLTDLCVRCPDAGAQRVAILDGVSLRVPRGEQIAVVGPSGAGKTTLLRVLALACQPDAGSIEAFGAAPWRMSSRARHRLRRRAFLAPQAPPLPPRQRVVTAVLAGRLPRWSLTTALPSLVRPREVELAHEARQRL